MLGPAEARVDVGYVNCRRTFRDANSGTVLQKANIQVVALNYCAWGYKVAAPLRRA